MSVRLTLESSTDTLNLNSQAETGTGVQVLAGVTGLGLPPVSVRWLEGAGDGATYRGRRVLPRDIDLPLNVLGRDRADLKRWVNRLADMMAGSMTLRLLDDNGDGWYTTAYRIGGGDYVYGVDTDGERELNLVVTLRAPDPFWNHETVASQVIANAGPTDTYLIPDLIQLPILDGRASGVLPLENDGTASAWPVWEITGPGNDLVLTSPGGDVLEWNGTLAEGETLTIDMKAATVKDGTGANRYEELAAAPKFWPIPPGSTRCNVDFQNTSTASRITLRWRTRRWLTI